jgi:hypothetical protein
MIPPLFHGLKPLINNNVIKLAKYLMLGVTYHQIIEPFIVEFVMQFLLDDFRCEKNPLNQCGC